MADNTPVYNYSGASSYDTIATDDVGGVKYQRVKLDGGGDAASVPIVAGQQTMSASLPVVVASDQSTINVNTELPTAAAITATGNSVPTTVITVAATGVYNGTTLDLVQSGAADAATSAQKMPTTAFVFNGSTYDRARTITGTLNAASTGIMAAGLVGQLDDASTTVPTEDNFATVRISSRRALLVEGVASGTNINTNVAQINGVAVTMGNGASGTGVQRVTLASDSTGQVTLAAGSAVIGALTANQSVNVAQINGVAATMGNGASGTGVQRVTIASDSTGILAGVTTVTTLTNITNWGNIVDNAAFTDGTTRLSMSGYIFDETAGTALTENDAAAARIDSKRAQVMVVEDATTRGRRQGVSSDGAARTVSKFLQVDASTLTRPANTTAYSANDAVSNNATAASVTAQTASYSAIADNPVTIERIRVRSTDTGVQGKAFRVYAFNSDPTASSGVGGGDNAAWSQKLAGFIGSFSGVFRTFSDGAVGIMVPDEGARVIAKPGSGVTTIWLLFQTLDAFTPSANSTTFIATLEGFQGHA